VPSTEAITTPTHLLTYINSGLTYLHRQQLILSSCSVSLVVLGYDSAVNSFVKCVGSLYCFDCWRYFAVFKFFVF